MNELPFKVKRYTFEELVHELACLERAWNTSSFQVYTSYLNDHYEHGNKIIEHWLDLIFLILGTDEIQQWSDRQVDRG